MNAELLQILMLDKPQPKAAPPSGQKKGEAENLEANNQKSAFITFLDQKIKEVSNENDGQINLREFEALFEAGQADQNGKLDASLLNILDQLGIDAQDIQALREQIGDINPAALNNIEPGAGIDADETKTIQTFLNDIGFTYDDMAALFGIETSNTKPYNSNMEKVLAALEELQNSSQGLLILTNLSPEKITELQAIATKIENGELNGLPDTDLQALEQFIDDLSFETVRGDALSESDEAFLKDILIDSAKEGAQEDVQEFTGVLVGLIRIVQVQADAGTLRPAPNPLAKTPEGQITNLNIANIPANADTAITASNLQPTGNGSALPSGSPLLDGEGAFAIDGDAAEGDGIDRFDAALQKAREGGRGDDGSAQNTNDRGAANTQNTPANVNAASPQQFNPLAFQMVDFTMADLDALGLNSSQFSLNALNSATSPLMQSAQAGQPHPATQMVAATMQKVGANGESRLLTLQLDPPELGRVEIKMTLAADKSVKAVLTAERPETYMMMQRDAQLLERALQDSGLDISADDSLRFELADQGMNFGQDGGHDGSRNDAANGSEQQGDDTDLGDIIETTMTWFVDQDTGHTHYSIMA